MTFENTLSPGQIIATIFGIYTHFSIVSDVKCINGKFMLISARNISNTVTEQPYDLVVQGRPTFLSSEQSLLPASNILKRARSKIGKWEYKLIDSNCEHFVRWVAGLNVTSKQVNSTLSGALIAGVATAAIVKNPSASMVLSMVLLGGFAGLAAAQLPTKQVNSDNPQPAQGRQKMVLESTTSPVMMLS